jgi:hypothetical protein
VPATDWKAVAYAVMSNHVHLALWSGEMPSARLVHPLHTGFARWLNHVQGRLGPVFAARHATYVLERERAAHLVEYTHNNAVRAGVFPSARETPLLWTSHRAYLGEEPAPPWLDVELGYWLMGRRFSSETIAEFDRLVSARAGEGRDPALSSEPSEERRTARQTMRVPGEVSSAMLGRTGRTVAVVASALAVRGRWPGQVRTAIDLVARYVGMPVESLVARRRAGDLVRARKLALLLWSVVLGRETIAMAASLGLSGGTASRQLAAAAQDRLLLCEAEALAEQLWEASSTEIAPKSPVPL